MALVSARTAALPRTCSTKKAIAAPLHFGRPCVAPQRQARSVVVKAESEDFDAYLNKMAEKFEKTENKPVVIGYVAAAAFAFITAEWLIHLPVLDFLLGFPVQLVGLLALPYLGVRWFVDGQSAGKDIEEAVGKVVSKLPGLDKK